MDQIISNLENMKTTCIDYFELNTVSHMIEMIKNGQLERVKRECLVVMKDYQGQYINYMFFSQVYKNINL